MPGGAGPPLEMERCVDLRMPLELGTELARPRVEAAQIAERDAAVDRVAQQLVPEVDETAGPGGSMTPFSISSWSGSSSDSGGTSMMPARTSGTKQRPMTAPALATACASGDRWPSRSSTASSMVSGTVASRIARPSARAWALIAPSSSSMWSGMPSVRSWTAATTSRGAGRPVSRMRVVTRAVWARSSGPSRISSATRWVRSLERQSRNEVPGGASSRSGTCRR